jgi:hypothetical protein
MSVANKRRHPAVPGFRQIRQLDRDSFHSCPGGIDDAIETCQQRQTKQRPNEHLPIRALAEKAGSALNCPTGASCQKAKTQDAQPDCGDGVEDPNGDVGISPGQ